MTAYAYTDDDGFVVMQSGEPDPDGMVGPLAPPLDAPYTAHTVAERVPAGSSPSEHHRLRMVDGAPAWVDLRPLSDSISAGVAAVDAAADAARARVVGDPVRVKEYERAQQQAEAFQAAGYTGAVPSSVACWATAKKWTPQEAAEDILAAAARWLDALDGIRALRLQAKEDIRRAASNTAVDARLATFIATLNAAMQGVQ